MNFPKSGKMLLELRRPTYTNLQSYRDRVESYIRKNKNHLTIRKLNTNEPITQAEIEELERLLFDKEKLGTREEFILEYGEMPLGKFIRSIHRCK